MPPGYTGYSCQLCSPGYFSNGESGGSPICEPCQCNSHAGTCHPTTGMCQDLIALPQLRFDCTDPELGGDPICTVDGPEGTGDDSKTIDPTKNTCHECGVYPTADVFCHFNPEMCEPPPMIGKMQDATADNCEGNTRGDHCELCDPGYFGEATREECSPCPCPLVDNK